MKSSNQFNNEQGLKYSGGASDQESARSQARADDDGFALAKKRKAGKDPDCWSDLWRQIKVKVAQLLNKGNKAKIIRENKHKP